MRKEILICDLCNETVPQVIKLRFSMDGGFERTLDICTGCAEMAENALPKNDLELPIVTRPSQSKCIAIFKKIFKIGDGA